MAMSHSLLECGHDEDRDDEVCSYCASDGKLQPALYFCFDCGVYGKFICGKCLKYHNKYLNNHEAEKIGNQSTSRRTKDNNLNLIRLQQSYEELKMDNNKLKEENKTLTEEVGPAGQSNKRQGNSEEIQHLKTELNKQVKENERLRKAHKEIEALLSQTVNKRNGSHQAQQGRGHEKSKQESQHKNGTTGNTDQVIKELQLKVQNQEDEINNLTALNESAQSYISHLKGIEKELEGGNLNALYHEKQALVQRLSDNNPAKADPSDPNRPTKIGEMYSEVYDNEWTDAFEALTNTGYDEREAVDTLRLTLLNIIQYCSKKSESLLERTEEAVNILFEEYKANQQMSEQWGKLFRGQSFDLDDISLQNKWKPKYQSDAKKNSLHKTIVKPNTSGEAIAKQLKIFRKDVSVSMVPLVEKAYISASWNEECINDLKPFIRKCLLIGWMMVVQSPPMTLEEIKPNEEFRKEIYKSYTQNGSHIDYVVWPALLLNQDGPVVGKGVAQGKQNN